jgi:hypothetical protein
MIRKQQNQIIIEKLVNKLQDIPNVQKVISEVFTDWFQAIVKSGLEQMQPAAGAGGSGEAAAGGAAPVEEGAV